MRNVTLWRVGILVATLFCIAMLFAPLISEMLRRIAQGGGAGPP